MKHAASFLAFSLLAASISFAQQQPAAASPAAPSDATRVIAPAMPTWDEEIARGHLPYHQLTVADFPIDDKTTPDTRSYVKAFVAPYPQVTAKVQDGILYLTVSRLLIHSGLDKSQSWRKSKVRDMKADLPFAQALLDMNELHARDLAAMPPAEFPQAMGGNSETTRASLVEQLKPIIEAKISPGPGRAGCLHEGN